MMTAAVRHNLPRTLLWLVAAALLVSSVRAELFGTHERIKDNRDVYLLPPPKQVRTLALGYNAAVADMFWAHTLVAQGLHLTDRRRFENVTRLYDAINELDPTWRTPYLLADALITLQTSEIATDDVVATRRVLERGVQHRPLDAEIWLNLGQFVAFVAPSSYLDHDLRMKEQWRREGLRYLERASELGAEGRIGWQLLGGAAMLARAGDREASIRFYERQYAVTDDPDLRKDIELRLKKLVGERDLGQSVRQRKAFDALRDDELPWVGDTTMLLLGPKPRMDCAGLGQQKIECATTWREWAKRLHDNDGSTGRSWSSH